MESATHILGAFAARRLGDENLFDRAMRGDAVAFSEVYRRYEKRVYGFCLARSLDREAAADATQEVFIRLLKAAPGTIDHPRAWLFAVARNVVTDSLRKHTRLRETDEVDEDAPAWGSMATADTADEVSARADARAVFLALRRVNPRYRTALILRELHGQSSADIAEAMGVKSSGAVDTLVSRARDAFGAAYAAVSELPPACRRTVELTYRSRGTGITTQENGMLQAHLASCEACRREDARAGNSTRLSALLPLLIPGGGAARSLLGRAALAGGSLPDLSVAQSVTQFLQTHFHTVGSRIAAGVLAATLVAAPVVGVSVVHHGSPRAVAKGDGAHASGASARREAAGSPTNRVGMSSSRTGSRGTRAARTGFAEPGHAFGVTSMHAAASVARRHGRSMTRPVTGTPAGGATAHTTGATRSHARTESTHMPIAGTTGGQGMARGPGM